MKPVVLLIYTACVFWGIQFILFTWYNLRMILLFCCKKRWFCQIHIYCLRWCVPVYTWYVFCLCWVGCIVICWNENVFIFSFCRLWDIECGACLRILEGHEELVRCIRFDNKRIVSGAYDGSVNNVFIAMKSILLLFQIFSWIPLLWILNLYTFTLP